MRNFWQFVETKSPIYIAGMENYEQTVRYYIRDFIIRYNDEVEDHIHAKVDYNKLLTLLNGTGYPHAQELVTALQNPQLAQEQLKQYYMWRQGKPIDPDLFMPLHNMLQVVGDQIRGEQAKISPHREQEWLQGILSESQKNIEFFKNAIEEAISRLDEWHGSQVTLKPRTNESTTDPISSATVAVGNTKADFTLFTHEGKLIPEDVLDWGDRDFFTDDETQSDYFALIRELENPGASSKPGKMLVLYTARPQKDREMYEKAAESGHPWIPPGIFLSNDPDHVEGLAVDLAGNEPRDIWMVKIDSNKVRLTNDTPRVKYYQAVGRDSVPVKSLTMY